MEERKRRRRRRRGEDDSISQQVDVCRREGVEEREERGEGGVCRPRRVRGRGEGRRGKGEDELNGRERGTAGEEVEV